MTKALYKSEKQRVIYVHCCGRKCPLRSGGGPGVLQKTRFSGEISKLESFEKNTKFLAVRGNRGGGRTMVLIEIIVLFLP